MFRYGMAEQIQTFRDDGFEVFLTQREANFI
jgi:hypothetical protein